MPVPNCSSCRCQQNRVSRSDRLTHSRCRDGLSMDLGIRAPYYEMFDAHLRKRSRRRAAQRGIPPDTEKAGAPTHRPCQRRVSANSGSMKHRFLSDMSLRHGLRRAGSRMHGRNQSHMFESTAQTSVRCKTDMKSDTSRKMACIRREDSR